MKRILISFLVFLSTIIALFHHSVIVFGHEQNIGGHNHYENNIVISHDNHDQLTAEKHDLDEEEARVSREQIKLSFEIIDTLYKPYFFDIHAGDYYLLRYKNLLRSTAPPIEQRKIKYYSYSGLTGITKSNT